MKFTKGPWAVDNQGAIDGPDGNQIGSLMPKNREANAHLIAAAPDLVEALRGVLQFAPYPWNQVGEAFQMTMTRESMDKARAILATIK